MRFVSLKFSVDFVVVQIAANPLLVNTKNSQGVFSPLPAENHSKRCEAGYVQLHYELGDSQDFGIDGDF